MSLLEDLLREARERAKRLPRREPGGGRPAARFDQAIRGKDRLKVVAEFKQASPSAGRIARRNLVGQVLSYVEAGASALSVLTEPMRFGGSLEDLELAARSVDVPVLMKDIVVDPAQVRIAACLGAGAVLLISRCLPGRELGELAAACSEYGLVPLVECHTREELDRALEIHEAVIGVNNRDLETLAVDLSRARRLLADIPPERVVVAESGYEKPGQARELRGLADAVLVGTALMRHADPGSFIREILR